MSELKEYRVVIGYKTYEYGYVEASSMEEARELIESGKEHPDWKPIDFSDWQIYDIFEE